MTIYKHEGQLYGWEDYQIEAGYAKGEPLTDEELAEMKATAEAQNDVAEAQAFLTNTDYTVTKCLESGLDIDIEYPELREKREKARGIVRKHKGELNAENS